MISDRLHTFAMKLRKINFLENFECLQTYLSITASFHVLSTFVVSIYYIQFVIYIKLILISRRTEKEGGCESGLS
jgi:hypothetical protein